MIGLVKILSGFRIISYIRDTEPGYVRVDTKGISQTGQNKSVQNGLPNCLDEVPPLP